MIKRILSMGLAMLLLVASPAIGEETSMRLEAEQGICGEGLPEAPVNPEADEQARAVYAALRSIYGKQVLTGQYASTNTSNEIVALYGLTGKRPAIRGFDFLFCSPAASWHVTDEVDKAVTDIDLSMLPLEEVRALYEAGDIQEEAYLIVRDIDAISKHLATLRDAGLTVLWRPLHEASGGWFWWGSKGPDAYRWLYRLMFDRQTSFHHLTNLLWVWNGQLEDWYVGDDYCDIVGIDIYAAPHSYTSQADAFLRFASIPTQHKLVAMTENGCVPGPDQMVRDNAMWLYYNTWCGEFVVNRYNRVTNTYTERTQLERVYEHPAMITLENLSQYGFHQEKELE